VGEECCDLRPSLDLLVEPFEAVGRSEPPPVGGWNPEDGEGLRHVLLEPGGELRGGLLVTGGDVPKPPLGLRRLVRVEDSTEVGGDPRPHGDLLHMGHGVLHEMELAALPGHPSEDGLPGGLEACMVITDDELHAPHATIEEALEEGSPVRLSLAELHAAAVDSPLAVGADADGREEGAGHDRPVVADFFVAGIEDEVGDLTDRPVPPGPELLVEFGRCPAYLGGVLSRPQRSWTTAVPFRVLTPWTYISATARAIARSVRTPCSSKRG
jgi:hypothetical protein